MADLKEGKNAVPQKETGATPKPPRQDKGNPGIWGAVKNLTGYKPQNFSHFILRCLISKNPEMSILPTLILHGPGSVVH